MICTVYVYALHSAYVLVQSLVAMLQQLVHWFPRSNYNQQLSFEFFKS